MKLEKSAVNGIQYNNLNSSKSISLTKEDYSVTNEERERINSTGEITNGILVLLLNFSDQKNFVQLYQKHSEFDPLHFPPCAGPQPLRNVVLNLLSRCFTQQPRF